MKQAIDAGGIVGDEPTGEIRSRVPHRCASHQTIHASPFLILRTASRAADDEREGRKCRSRRECANLSARRSHTSDTSHAKTRLKRPVIGLMTGVALSAQGPPIENHARNGPARSSDWLHGRNCW